jgi:hypothetical protein
VTLDRNTTAAVFKIHLFLSHQARLLHRHDR